MWTSFNIEATNLKQKLTNKNFSISVIDREVKKIVINKVEVSAVVVIRPNQIKLFLHSHLQKNFTKNELILNQILSEHVRSLSAIRLSLMKYCKNNPFNSIQESQVVYNQTCPEIEYQKSQT